MNQDKKYKLKIIVETKGMHPEFYTTETTTKEFTSLEDAEIYYDVQRAIEEKSGGFFSVEIKIVKNYNP